MKFAGKTRGFTIVEMLTVMGIIAILIGLLVPALNQVKDYARQIQQRSQFHSIDVALEMFKTEFGAYPESNDNIDIEDNTNNHPNDAFVYCGANKMAEALMGLDLLGFHPNSEYRSTGQSIVTFKDGVTKGIQTVYWAYDNSQGVNWETASENMRARKGPFIEAENANAFRMDDIYPAAGLTAGSYSANYIVPGAQLYPLALCDVYAKKRDGVGNKKTGMPILYYRARTTYTLQDYRDKDPVSGKNDDIYYYPDNYHLLVMGTPEITPVVHPLWGGNVATYQQNFENLILNKQLSPVKRPYRANSYILISAGKDGLYGSGDDIFNFDKAAEQ